MTGIVHLTRVQINPVAAKEIDWFNDSFSAGRIRSPRPATTSELFITAVVYQNKQRRAAIPNEYLRDQKCTYFGPARVEESVSNEEPPL
jgi:hypothetical protein